MEVERSCYGGGQFNHRYGGGQFKGGRMVKLHRWSV